MGREVSLLQLIVINSNHGIEVLVGGQENKDVLGEVSTGKEETWRLQSVGPGVRMCPENGSLVRVIRKPLAQSLLSDLG